MQADQADLARTQTQSAFAPSAFPSGVVDGHVAPSPNDADLVEQEILKRAEGYQPFTASAAVPFYWTSNVALVRTGEQSDFLVAPVVAISYQPRITNTLYGMVGVREQLFYYNRFSDSWRVVLKLEPKADNKDPVDIRCTLQKGEEVLTETWTYHWSPP